MAKLACFRITDADRSPATHSGSQARDSATRLAIQSSISLSKPAHTSRAEADWLRKCAFAGSPVDRTSSSHPDFDDYLTPLSSEHGFHFRAAVAFSLTPRRSAIVAGAREDYATALRLTPDDAKVFYNRATLREAQGDMAGACEDYDTAIRLKPEYAAALKSRGALRQTQGDLTGAREDYATALRLTPDDAEVFYNRATLREAQDLAGACEDYDTALRLKPDVKGQ